MNPTIYPGSFMVWLTVLIPGYEAGIVAGIIKKGYKVSCPFESGIMTIHQDDRMSALIGIRVDTKDPKVTCFSLKNDLVEITTDLQYMVHSIIISPLTDCAGVPSNIYIAPKTPAAKPEPKVEDKNLN